MTRARRLLTDRKGSAAAEMAMSLPIMFALIFGSFELGHFFLSEHSVQKAVRDAARYAARLPMQQADGTVNFDCSSGTIDPSLVQQIQKVARTGQPDGTTQRLQGWSADSMTTVTLSCVSDVGQTYVANGVYLDFPNGGAVPVVTVVASVPYPSLFDTLGIGTTGLQLNARSQTGVFGA